MIFKSAYETTAMAGHIKDNTLSAIIEYIIKNNGWPTYPFQEIAKYPSGVIQIAGTDSDGIPNFTQPILIDVAQVKKYTTQQSDLSLSHNDGYYIAVDQRPYIGQDRNGQLKVSSRGEYIFGTVNASLSLQWANHGGKTLDGITGLLSMVYASWLSQQIAHRYTLDPRDQYRLFIYAAYYYYILNNDSVDLPGQHERNMLAPKIAHNLRANVGDVLDIMELVQNLHDQDHVLKDINSFCKLAADIVGTPRLKDLDARIIYSVTSSAWFHPNVKQIIPVALEFPPTFAALLFMAGSERSYANTVLTKVAERTIKSSGLDVIMRSVGLMMSR